MAPIIDDQDWMQHYQKIFGYDNIARWRIICRSLSAKPADQVVLQNHLDQDIRKIHEYISTIPYDIYNIIS